MRQRRSRRRIDPNGPIIPMPPARLGDVTGDRQRTIIAYRAPTVLVSVKTEDGAVPEELSVMARYTIRGAGLCKSIRPAGHERPLSQPRALCPIAEYAIRSLGPS